MRQHWKGKTHPEMMMFPAAIFLLGIFFFPPVGNFPQKVVIVRESDPQNGRNIQMKDLFHKLPR